MSEIGSPQYPQLNPPQSAFQTLGTAASAIGQMQQNRLFPQQQQELQNRIELQKQSIQQQQIETARKNIDTFGSYLTPLAANPNATVADVMTAVSKAITAGHVDPKVIGPAISDMPKNDAQIPAWLQQQHMRFLDTQAQFNALHPVPTMVQTGSGQFPAQLPQVGNMKQVGPFIPNTPGPTTQFYDPQSQQMKYVGVNPPGGAAGFAPGTAAAPPLGAEQAASTTAAGGAQQGLALQQRADRAQDNKAILGNLEAELGDFTTGPGTEGLAHFNKFVNAQLGTNVYVGRLAAREQFNKLAGLLAQSQFQALGGTGANAQLEATTLTSPNSELSKMGNKGIIAMLKGNEDAIKAKNEYWQAYSKQNGTGSYGQFLTQFQKVYDPRVFQAQYLDDAGKRKMLSGMTQPEKNQLHQSAQFARQNGWIK